jgi:hypothetical protein
MTALAFQPLKRPGWRLERQGYLWVGRGGGAALEEHRGGVLWRVWARGGEELSRGFVPYAEHELTGAADTMTVAWRSAAFYAEGELTATLGL